MQIFTRKTFYAHFVNKLKEKKNLLKALYAHNPIDKIECDTSSWDCKLQSNPIVSDLSVQINRLNTDDVHRSQQLTVAESHECVNLPFWTSADLVHMRFDLRYSER